MKKYFGLLSILLVFAIFIFFVVRPLGEETEERQPYETPDTVIQPEIVGSVSEYFDRKFEQEREAEIISITPAFDTCELFGQVVKEGTVIFDSTCAAE